MFLKPVEHENTAGKAERLLSCDGLDIWTGSFMTEGEGGPEQARYIALIPQTGKLELHFKTGEQVFAGPGDLLLMAPEAGPEKVLCDRACVEGILAVAEKLAVCGGLQRAAGALFSKSLTGEALNAALEQQNGCLVMRDEGWCAALMAGVQRLAPEERGGFILLKLLEQICLILGGAGERRECHYYDDYQMQAIRQVHDYMLAHLEQPLTIDFLAKEFQLSPTFLKSCFRRVYGEPVHAYLQRQRLRRAAQMLLETRERVYAIAIAVGYSSASRFGVAFRTQYHMTPCQYRRALRKNV